MKSKKAIITFLFIFLLVFLYSCNNNNQMPNVKNKHIITLSNEEYKEKIADITFNYDNAFLFNSDMSINGYMGGANISSKVLLESYFIENKSINDIEMSIQASGIVGLNMNYDMKLYFENSKYFVDLNNFKMSMGAVSMDIEKGKYKLDNSSLKDLNMDGLLDFDTSYFEFLQEDEFSNLISSESKLITFYEYDGTFSIKFELSKDKLKNITEEDFNNLPEFISEYLTNYDILQEDIDLDLIYIASFKDNKIKEFGIEYKLKYDISDTNKMDLDIKTYGKSNQKMPSIPSADEYTEDFDAFKK